jgi:hypothetical protein
VTLHDRFRRYYNTIRPHRALSRAAPAQAYTARPKAHPAGPRLHRHYRVRRDRVDPTGVVTLRYNSRLRHIGLGREHAGTRFYILVADLHTRVVDAETGELLRELTLDPNRDYQPTGRPPGPPKNTEPVADIELLGLDCLASLEPGQACSVTPAANPRSGGTTNGAIEFATPSSRKSSQAVNALLRVPVVIRVTRTDPTSTGTTSPDTTATTTPPSTTTQTVEPSADQTTSRGERPYDPASWIQPTAGGLAALILAALIFVGALRLSRRLRQRRPRAGETRVQSHAAGPSITVRSDPGRSVIDDRSRPVLTLVAVSPRPVTTITEEEP